MRTARIVLIVAAASLASAAPSSAAQRYAAPAATATSPCTQTQPCRIDAAVNDAAAGDEVIVAPGTYAVTTGLEPDHPIDLHGMYDGPRPRLVGASDLGSTTLTLKAGGTARHLEIRATAPSQYGLQIKTSSARAERLVVWAAGAYGAKLVPSTPATVLRDSVVGTDGTASDTAAIKLQDGATGETLELTNVTAWAPNGRAIGIRCDAVKSAMTVLNTIARGAGADLEANGSQCAVAHSNVRPAQSGDPGFRDPAAGDFALVAGSPLVDAGAAGPSLGTRDLDGRSRVIGRAPDIGAHELGASTPLSSPPPGVGPGLPDAPVDMIAAPRDALPTGAPTPVLGTSVVLAPAGGRVLVRVPGRRGFTPLRTYDDVPLGAVVDATRGVVRLTTALPGTAVQTASFSGGRFSVRQPRAAAGMADVILRGGDFSTCRRKRTIARTAARRRAVRRLWGSDHAGRFRTRGRDSAATVRGTRWLTEDRCAGTYTRVVEGVVDVKSTRTGVVTRVAAGQDALVRHRR